MATETKPTKRRYEKKARAAQEEETRSRISRPRSGCTARWGRRARPSRRSPRTPVCGGPPSTATSPMSAPCSSAAQAPCGTQPAARPADLELDPDPAARLEAALEALYPWYERVEPMLTAVLRDADTVPMVKRADKRAPRLPGPIEDGLARAGAYAGPRQAPAGHDRPGTRLPRLADPPRAGARPRRSDRRHGVGGGRGGRVAASATPRGDRRRTAEGLLAGPTRARAAVRSHARISSSPIGLAPVTSQAFAATPTLPAERSGRSARRKPGAGDRPDDDQHRVHGGRT